MFFYFWLISFFTWNREGVEINVQKAFGMHEESTWKSEKTEVISGRLYDYFDFLFYFV